MNQQLQTILDIVEQNENLTADEKTALIKAVKKADSDLTISEFKLERTEKVKRTTAILLEETIEELEQKRKAVEAHNRELEIEAALERVRAKAMAMHNSDDLATTIRVFYEEFVSLSSTPIIRCGAGVFRERTPICDISSISLSSKNELEEVQGVVNMSGHPLLKGAYKNWLKQKE